MTLSVLRRICYVSVGFASDPKTNKALRNLVAHSQVTWRYLFVSNDEYIPSV